MVIGPDGQPVAVPAETQQAADDAHDDDEAAIKNVTDLVEQPAKVMRIGRMVQQLLEEVKAAPVDEAGRKRLARVLHTSISELKDGLAPELDEELARLIHPFEEETPSESELRIAQAQLVGWLEGSVPRHPDSDLRAADVRALTAGADEARTAARSDARDEPGAAAG